MSGGGADRPAEIMLVLPDSQTVRVRLHERQEAAEGSQWRYLIGVPAWVATREGVEAAEYSVCVTADQLRPISGVDLFAVATYKLPAQPPPVASGWTVGPGGRKGQSVVHDMACRNGPPLASELNTLEALDALERPGARACDVCDAAAILVPALELGSR
ncbi:DUF6233 domain-containing protein [Streptomyces niveus]|uniref:DUF6233 domain-containing protein n=1 Tax=Streptomyces niveus TaxID=193462 RepID=UPI0003C59C1A|nr:DUF6233 domain-containing protein [Streptomyces niveus]EST31746.1 hypothetical protein M877_06310 [Streptomyces niveus NCIMB 11891]